MEDEQTNETDTQGTESNSELEKLKASNNEFEQELIRGRELKAESQKLEAEKMLSGNTGGHVEPVVEDPAQKMADEMVNAFN